MSYQLENVEHYKHLPIRIFFHSIKGCSYHWHRDIEILFVINGTILVQADFQEFLLKKEDLFLVNSGDIHLTHDAGDNNLILALQIDPTFIEKHDPEITLRRFDFNSVFRKNPDLPIFKTIREIVSLIMWEVRIKKQGYTIKIEGLLNELFSILLRDFKHVIREAKAEEKLDRENADNFPRIKRIIQHIEKEYEKRLSLAEIAEKENLSLGYLSRFFKEKTGCNFTEFVNLIRVKKSLQDLVKTERKITDIALDSGFVDVKAYNTFFKRTYRMTPSRWRNEYKKKPTGLNQTGSDTDTYASIDPRNAFAILKQYISEKNL